MYTVVVKFHDGRMAVLQSDTEFDREEFLVAIHKLEQVFRDTYSAEVHIVAYACKETKIRPQILYWRE